jgi:hypothetical protein
MIRSMLRTAIVVTAFGLALGLPAMASAHNRAHIVLPTGRCIIVGSEKSVILPDGTMLDLRPETPPSEADEFGTSYAATEGNSAIEKGACP